MTLPSNPTSGSEAGDAASRAERGFTLIEMLAVLVISGIMVGLVISRGPMRSVTLDVQAAASAVAQGLRLARGQAIAGNRDIAFILDTTGHSFRIGTMPPRGLPPAVSLSARVASDEVAGRTAGIGFLPDGSSTGGSIAFAEGGRTVLVKVDWLTGRVSVADAQ